MSSHPTARSAGVPQCRGARFPHRRRHREVRLNVQVSARDLPPVAIIAISAPVSKCDSVPLLECPDACASKCPIVTLSESPRTPGASMFRCMSIPDSNLSAVVGQGCRWARAVGIRPPDCPKCLSAPTSGCQVFQRARASNFLTVAGTGR